MKKWPYAFFLLVLLCQSTLSHAMTGIFWQPQLRDNNISNAQWASLMASVRQQGFDALIVQWTQFGEAFSGPEKQAILQKRMEAARRAGLQLIVGLNADPGFFTLQKQPAAVLSGYLSHLKERDIQQANYWSKMLTGQISGWYISAEIDDTNWRDAANSALMKQWLRGTRSSLSNIVDKPVYISSFFSGNTSPEHYSALISELHGTGLNVWVQNGSGTHVLTAGQRAAYLEKSAGCGTITPASGTVYELFTISSNNTIIASQDEIRNINSMLNTPSPCRKEHLYFSLRYLPIAANIMEKD